MPMFKLVVVAEGPVALVKVKVDTFARVTKRSVAVAAVDTRLPMKPRVDEKSVEVAAVEVESPMERYW